MTETSIREIASAKDRAILRADFTGRTPVWLYDAFTTPETLVRWWPMEVPAIDPVVGGVYALGWSAMKWTLRGVYRAAAPGEILAFSWRWDHQPDLPEREVTVTFHGIDGGAALTLIHGFYGDSAVEQEDRQGHIDGWMHFLGQLQALDN